MIGIDQFGYVYQVNPKHPRKSLLDQLGRKSCDKMYQDGENGEIYHVGYVVGEFWIALYNENKKEA